jgi:hypothetical protein
MSVSMVKYQNYTDQQKQIAEVISDVVGQTNTMIAHAVNAGLHISAELSESGLDIEISLQTAETEEVVVDAATS